MIKSAVLTGPTGVLGTALIKRLDGAGVEAYVVCHRGSPRNASILEHPCIHKVECDMEEIGRLPELIVKSVEVSVHSGGGRSTLLSLAYPQLLTEWWIKEFYADCC